jgi:hypothetical protein
MVQRPFIARYGQQVTFQTFDNHRTLVNLNQESRCDTVTLLDGNADEALAFIRQDLVKRVEKALQRH